MPDAGYIIYIGHQTSNTQQKNTASFINFFDEY